MRRSTSASACVSTISATVLTENVCARSTIMRMKVCLFSSVAMPRIKAPSILMLSASTAIRLRNVV